MTDYKNLKLIASSSPHIRSNEDTRSIMLDVIIALLPALAWSVYCFGWKALLLTAVSVVSCVFWEWAYRKLMKKSNMVGDLSAVVRRRAADGHAVDREPRQSVQRDHHQHGSKSPEQREKERRGIARKERAEQTAHHEDGERARCAEGIERVDRHDVRKPELYAGQRQQRREKGLQIGERERQRGKHGAGRDSFR